LLSAVAGAKKKAIHDFSFDKVFEPEACQGDVYEEILYM
jgi:hypothetical protein